MSKTKKQLQEEIEEMKDVLREARDCLIANRHETLKLKKQVKVLKSKCELKPKKKPAVRVKVV